MRQSVETAGELREALRPIWRRLVATNTISLGKLGILAYLAENGSATAATLATAERVTAQAVATALRELEDVGYVARRRDDVDRRRVWVELTAAGRDALDSERALGQVWLVNAIGTELTDAERDVLESALPILRKLGHSAYYG